MKQKPQLSARKSQKHASNKLKQQDQQQNEPESNMVKDVKNKIEAEFQSFQQILKNVYNDNSENKDPNRLSTAERYALRQKIRQNNFEMARYIQSQRVLKNQERNETPFQKLQRNLDNMSIHDSYLRENDDQFRKIHQYNINNQNIVDQFGINMLPNIQKKEKMEDLKEQNEENHRYLKYQGQKYFQILQEENFLKLQDEYKDNLVVNMKSFSSLADYIKPSASLKIKKMNRKQFKEQSRQSLLNMLKNTHFDNVPMKNSNTSKMGNSIQNQGNLSSSRNKSKKNVKFDQKNPMNVSKSQNKLSDVNKNNNNTSLRHNPTTGRKYTSTSVQQTLKSLDSIENKSQMKQQTVPKSKYNHENQDKLKSLLKNNLGGITNNITEDIDMEDSQLAEERKMQNLQIMCNMSFKNKNNKNMPVKARFSSVAPMGLGQAFNFQNSINNNDLNSSGITEEVLQESEEDRESESMVSSRLVRQKQKKNQKIAEKSSEFQSSFDSGEDNDIRGQSQTNGAQRKSFIEQLEKSLKREQNKQFSGDNSDRIHDNTLENIRNMDHNSLENLPIDLMIYYYKQDKSLKELNQMLFNRLNKFPEKRKRQLEEQINCNNARVYQELRQSLPDIHTKRENNHNNNNNKSINSSFANSPKQKQSVHKKHKSRIDQIKQSGKKGNNNNNGDSSFDDSFDRSRDYSIHNTSRRKSSLYLPKVSENDPEIQALQNIKKKVEKNKARNQSMKDSRTETNMINSRNLQNLTIKYSQMRQKYNTKLKGPTFKYSDLQSEQSVKIPQQGKRNSYQNESQEDLKLNLYNNANSSTQMHSFALSENPKNKFFSTHLNSTQDNNNNVSQNNYNLNLIQSSQTAKNFRKPLKKSQLEWVKNKQQIWVNKKRKQMVGKLVQNGYTHKQAEVMANSNKYLDFNKGNSSREIDNPFFYALESQDTSILVSKYGGYNYQGRNMSIGNDLSGLESQQ